MQCSLQYYTVAILGCFPLEQGGFNETILAIVSSSHCGCSGPIFGWPQPCPFSAGVCHPHLWASTIHGSFPLRIHSIIFPTSFLFVFDGWTTNGHLTVGHGPPTGPTTIPFRFPLVGKSLRDSSGFDPELTRDGSGLSFRFWFPWDTSIQTRVVPRLSSSTCRRGLTHFDSPFSLSTFPFQPDRPRSPPDDDSPFFPSFPSVCRRGSSPPSTSLSSFPSLPFKLPFRTRLFFLSFRLSCSNRRCGATDSRRRDGGRM